MSLRNSTLIKNQRTDKSLTNSQISNLRNNNSKLRNSSKLKNSQKLETKSSLKSTSNYGNISNIYSQNQSKVQRQNSNRSLNNSQRSVSPSTRFNNKTDLSGFQIVQDSPRNRTLVNKLGLKLEAICQKQGHDRQKINFMCIARDCEQERLGCATCFLEEHNDHTDYKIRIEEFLEGLKDRYEEYYDELKEFKNISQKLESPYFLTDIIQELEEIKLYFSTKIEDSKLQVLRDYEKLIQDENMNFAQQVQNQKCYSVKIDNSMQKTIFEMDDEDIDSVLQLWHKSHFNNISKTSFSVENRMAELENLFKTSFEMYKSNIKYEIDQLWENYKSMDLPDRISDDEKKLVYLQSKKKALERHFKTNEQINKQLQDLQTQLTDTEIKLGITQPPQLPEPHDCHTQQKRLQSPIKAKIISSVSPQRFINSPLRNNLSNQIGSKSDLNQSTYSQQTQQKSAIRNVSPRGTMNMILQQNNTSQIINSSQIQNTNTSETINNLNHDHEGEENMTTVPIFDCCQQAFKCVSCHNNYSKDHKAEITNPSKRYCLKCNCVFSVNMPSDTAVPCVQCNASKKPIIQQQQPQSTSSVYVRSISQSKPQQLIQPQQISYSQIPQQRISRQHQHNLTSQTPQILSQSILQGNQSTISQNQSYILRK